MTKGKLVAFGIVFIIAIALIILGALFSKKENVKIPEPSKSDYRNSYTPDEKDNPFNGTAEIPNQLESTEGLENIYDILESAKLKSKNEVELKHDGLKYTINMPKADISDLTVKETRKNYVVSTGFYYKGTDGTDAMVFNITNYPIREWEKIAGASNDIVVAKTPIRVITYALASDNPFDPDSEDSKQYLAYVEKVPSYLKDFDMYMDE